MDIEQPVAIKNNPQDIGHNSSSNSSKYNTNKLTKKQEQIQLYFNQKECEICHSQRNCKQLYLCDRCDDGYHLSCIGLYKKPTDQQNWFCPLCIQNLKQIQEFQAQNSISKQQNCYKCNKSLKQQQFYIKILNQDNIPECALLTQLRTIQCLYCCHMFHELCFGERKNSLNCSVCQRKIRNANPKNHLEFMKMINNHIEQAEQLNFQTIKISSIDQFQNKILSNKQRFSKLCLQLPKLPTSWEAIVRYEASLAYALTSKKVFYTDSQLYNRELISVQANQSRRLHECRQLNHQDQLTFRRFLQYARKGLLGPYEVKEDRIKGFYLIATDYIQRNTIISEYVGQVLPTRQSLKDCDNDSIFSLIRSTRTATSIDVCPQKFGGICRFICGINNSNKHQFRKLQNVRSIRFQLDKKVRVIFFAKRKIQAGQTLYIDYNGTAFEQYPTDSFVE